jgi:hypothetical protein
VVDYGHFGRLTVLVHFFESRAFQVVGSVNGGADRQHRNVVLSCFFYLAESK